jgi:hypothetical protein
MVLEKLTGSQLVKKFPTVYGLEGSLPHSPVPATCPYLSQLDPVHTPTSHFLKIHTERIISMII